jgi:hypothetical protein
VALFNRDAWFCWFFQNLHHWQGLYGPHDLEVELTKLLQLRCSTPKWVSSYQILVDDNEKTIDQ